MSTTSDPRSPSPLMRPRGKILRTIKSAMQKIRGGPGKATITNARPACQRAGATGTGLAQRNSAFRAQQYANDKFQQDPIWRSGFQAKRPANRGTIAEVRRHPAMAPLRAE